MKKVLILGGGFAGVQAAIDLQKNGRFEVTLVSDRPYMYLFPISIWIPVHGIKEEKTRISLQDISKKHGFTVHIDKVSSILSAQNKVICEQQSFHYDYLIVAFGADKMQMNGIEHTTTICGKPEQTLDFRKQLDALIDKGKGKIAIGFGGNPKDKSSVRGGPAFELIFNIDHYLRKLHIREQFELNMFAPMPEPGKKMGKKAVKNNDKMMASKGINTYYGKKITAFKPNGVLFEDDFLLSSDITMFIAAGVGSNILRNSDLPLTEAGFVSIDENCKVPTKSNVYAIGDAAAMEGPDWIAKQGHLAEVMGSIAAYNILQKDKGSPKKKSYKKHLSVLCIMDVGNAAVLVYRKGKKEIMIPMPIFGHWVKQAWGVYARWTKLRQFPKIF